ncbi:MAG: hypothetical protein ACRES7_10685, partial [Gammaproteobacteria bacterium]
MNARRGLRVLAQPAFILPVLLAAALLVVAFKLGGLGRVLGRVQAIPLWIMVASLALAALYLALKFLQLHLLLANLGIRPKWRRLALAFSVGELAVTLPFGIFAQNWILSASGKFRFGRSSAATVVMLLAETAVVLLLLAIVGIPRWPELRPIAVVFLVGLAFLLFGVLRFEQLARRLAHKVKKPALYRTLIEVIGLIQGLKRLSNARILAVNLLLAAAYL